MNDKPREWMDERLFALLLTALYAWLVLGTIRVHEPWRDEAQTWLIGRDASLAETFALLRYQAHPALWYLLVRPLARLGAPYAFMGLLHGLLAVGSAFLVLRFAPLPRLTRALLVFSFWMVWMYAVESRVYAVGILLMFLIAWRYPQRHEQPWRHGLLVALLFNSNLHMAFLAAGLSALFAWETVRARRADAAHGLALALMGAGALLLVWQFDFFRPPPDNMHGGSFVWSNPPSVILRGVTTAFFPGVQNFYGWLAPLALAMMALLFWTLRARPAALFLAAAHVVGVSLLLWLTSALSRHYGLFLLGGVFALWVAADGPDAGGRADFQKQRRAFLWGLNLCLAFSLYEGWKLNAMDRKHDFSGTRRMAEYIWREGLARYPIAVHRYAHLSSIAPYFPGRKFWYIGRGEWVTYVRQDAAHRRANEMSHEEAAALLEQQVPAGEPLLLLTDKPLKSVPPGFVPLHKVDETVRGTDEMCYLYARDVSRTGGGGLTGARSGFSTGTATTTRP
ncbi:MAG TPA: hypothetical protein P5567_05330 [Kiritimatiellia bacterium]|nr:hypothetical protein [Kiritimatiellia bacterium]HRZ11859.1 hypothetical protein [Kiritimatiellia bacterium]HSA17335.1 hypothetical protein [Kiritimatiellia bacterium]